jgi:hypothetical protein
MMPPLADHPPILPSQLSDGGGTDVGGVVSQQTQDTGTNSNAPPVNEEGNGGVAPAGWIANGAGGWTSPDGAHRGPREKPSLELANDKEDQQRALQSKREERMRRSSADERDSYVHLANSPTRKTVIPRHWRGD